MPPAPLIFAVSVNHEIERFGSYCGLAAIVGLAVLSLLYMSQAREVRRLRDWAGRGPERAAELEERVRVDAQKRIVAQPIGAQTAAGQAAASRVAAATPSIVPPAVPPGSVVPAPAAPGALGTAPATPGLPGAAPATPIPGTIPSGVPPALPAQAAGAPTRIVPVHRTPGVGDALAGGTTQTPAGEATAPPTPAPSSTTVSGAPPATPAFGAGPPALGNGSPSAPEPSPLYLPPEPSRGLRATSTLSPREAVEATSSRRDSGGVSGRSIAAVVGVLVIIAAIVIVATNGGGSGGTPGNHIGSAPVVSKANPAPVTTPGTTTPALDRASIKVAVLNGTTQADLARSVANELEKKGFTVPTVTNAVDQTQTTTTVAYEGDNRRAAGVIAQIVGVPSSSVQIMDRDTQVAAGGADVVVTAGSDRIG